MDFQKLPDAQKAYGAAMDALYSVKEEIAHGLFDLQEEGKGTDPRALRALLDRVYDLAAEATAVDWRIGDRR